MPWSIKKEDGKFCVIKDDGSVEGCHDSRADATAQQRALYASENKEKGYYYGTYGATSFDQYDNMVEAMEKRDRLSQLHMAFMGIVDNIMWDEDIVDKSAAIRQATDEMCSRMDSDSTKEAGFLSKVKSLFKKKEPEKEVKEAGDNIYFFKSDDGVYNWVARYSNNFRDDDVPAEIISSKSHEKFAELVKAGAVKPPDLWYWHVPDWKWGEGRWVSYDAETGFALAGGVVYPEFNEFAETLAKAGDVIGVSHGMPAWSITRDEQDPTVIIEHITEEVSPLPLWAAANKLTQFAVNKEIKDMALSKEEKARLSAQHGVSTDLLSKLDARSAKDAAKAISENRDSKEVGAADAAVDPVQEEVTEDVAATQVAAEVQDDTPAAEVVPSGELKEISDILETVLKSVLSLSERMDTFQRELEQVKTSDADKVAKQAAVSPLASLAALVQKSVIGDDATRVDGRTSLARSTPAEVQAEATGPYPFPIVNDLIAGRWGKQ